MENQLPTQASLLQTGKRSLWAWLAQPSAPPWRICSCPLQWGKCFLWRYRDLVSPVSPFIFLNKILSVA